MNNTTIIALSVVALILLIVGPWFGRPADATARRNAGLVFPVRGRLAHAGAVYVFKNRRAFAADGTEVTDPALLLALSDSWVGENGLPATALKPAVRVERPDKKKSAEAPVDETTVPGSFWHTQHQLFLDTQAERTGAFSWADPTDQHKSTPV